MGANQSLGIEFGRHGDDEDEKFLAGLRYHTSSLKRPTFKRRNSRASAVMASALGIF